MDVTLIGRFTLRSPLSHIGESIGTTSYLAQEPVLQPDGAIEEVFCYSGNAWRGQLRDCSAVYLLRRLGDPRVSLDAFHLLFSGGRIGGEQNVKLDQARTMRRTLPHVALFGGGVGNQILPGKLRVANSYPVCREAPPGYDPALQSLRERVSYRSLTVEKSFSRKDDAKDDRLLPWLADAAGGPGQPALPGDGRGPARAKAKDGPADQMRMTVELVIAGAILETRLDLLEVSEVELGCLVAAVGEFGRSPHIGGQASRGHGLVDLAYQAVGLDVAPTPFLAVEGGGLVLSPPAEAAKAAYDAYLRELYDAYLDANQPELRRLLGAA